MYLHRSFTHRLITLRNGIGNAIHCQSIIIVSLSYDVIDNVLSRDGHEERKTLIAMLQNDHPDVNVNGDSQGSALAMLPFTLKLL